MASSGSTGRPNSASNSKGFDFASDDILCSYEDYGVQDGSNGSHSDPSIGVSSSKDFHKSRMARSSPYPPSAYSPQDDSFGQDVISTVESTMKKYADNLMRFLEGISSRMSQLELYCYNLDKSIGEMRSDLGRDHGEADVKLKSLEKHLQEVHRSVQILRDKQELAETQKELAKLQMVQKESSSVSHSQQNEERSATPTSDPKPADGPSSDMNNQHLALALPHQVAPQPSLPSRPMEQQQQQSIATHSQAPPPNMTPQQSYYAPPAHLPNPPAQAQHLQGPYMPSDPRYQTQMLQDMSRVSRVAAQPVQPQVSQGPPVQSIPQYQQQWSSQMPQVQPPQQQSVQPQIRPPSSAAVYPYPSQTANASIAEALPSSMPMQVSFSGMPQPGGNRSEAISYGYGGAGRTMQQSQSQSPQPPQHVKGTFGAQPGDGGYSVSGPHSTLSAGGNTYMIYDSEGARGSHHPQQSPFPQGGYPPTSASIMVRNPSPPQFVRNNPYTELIEKLISMGYRGDHVVDVIQRMEENGQPVDFNSVLDRLNGHSSGGSQRGGW